MSILLRRDVYASAFQNFQESLLNTFARNVAIHARLTSNFINLVYVNYPALRLVNIAVRRINQR